MENLKMIYFKMMAYQTNVENKFGVKIAKIKLN